MRDITQHDGQMDKFNKTMIDQTFSYLKNMKSKTKHNFVNNCLFCIRYYKYLPK